MTITSRRHREAEAISELLRSRIATSKYLLIKIAPFRIHSIDQIQFTLPGAGLYLLLTRYSALCTLSRFEIHQLRHVITLREAVHQLVLVLVYPTHKIIGHTGIENRVAGIGDDIDVKLSELHVSRQASASITRSPAADSPYPGLPSSPGLRRRRTACPCRRDNR